MKWLPLESNPEIMNKFISDLGANGSYTFVDVYGLDSELLAMVPQPVAALLLLFPITEKYEKFFLEEEKKITESPQQITENLFFVKQTISNACGTIGLIHAVCNNAEKFNLGGFFKEFFESTKTLSPADRATKLEQSETLSAIHHELANEGQSTVPDINEAINLHFICFVEKDGQLYELDGRKKSPIVHGASSPETFLEDSAKVIQQFMQRDPDNLQFTMVALSQAEE